MLTAPYSPVCDYRALPTKSAHEGVLYDPVTGVNATLTRTTVKTIYDASTGLIHDVAAGYLAVRPWSNSKTGGIGYETVIEESRVNKLLDSYFANATIGTNWASDVTLSRSDTVTPPYGTHAALAEYTGAGGDSNATKVLIRQDAAYVATNNVTSSWYVYGAVTGCQCQLYMEALDAGSNVLGTVTANVTPSATWARSTLTYTNLPANTAMVRGGLRCTGVDTGDTIAVRASAAQRELGAFATSYIPTTTATFTRNADVVSFPSTGVSPSTGTLMVVAGVCPTYAVTAGGYLANLYYDGNRYINLFVQNGQINSYLKNTTLYSAARTSLSAAAHVLATKWADGTPLYAYSDGAVGATVSGNITAASVLATSVSVGSNIGSSSWYNAGIQRVICYSSALSDAQILILATLINGCYSRDPVPVVSLGGGISWA